MPGPVAEKAIEMMSFRQPTADTELMWEYPRATPEGDQMDFTEVLEFDPELIRGHRVYWGWYGVRTLTTGSHSR
jgi:hypothetical protein